MTSIFTDPIATLPVKPAPKPVPQKKPPPASQPPVGKGRQVAATEPATPPVAPIKAPVEPPQPALTNIGFNGGINEFNQRVQKAHDTFAQIHGYDPTPGLVLDIARSSVLPTQFSPLLQPTSQTLARNQAAVANHPAADTLVVRHDGMVEQNHPTNYALLAHDGELGPQPVTPAAPAQPSRTLAQYQSLQSQHPWVAMGMLPISNKLQTGFWQAVQYAQDNPGAVAPLTEGGMTLAQYNRENDIGVQAGKLGQPLSLLGDAQGKQIVSFGVTTVKAAQDNLKQIAPDFFQDLPSTGYVNSDWAKAIGKYQTSALYFSQQTKKLATDNHFGTNVAAFTHAWAAKQAAIKEQPFLATFLAHQPLAFFDSRTHGHAVLNLVDGNTKGWGWANVPTVALGSLANVAGLAFHELAGTVDQAKQDSAFVTSYMQTIAPKWVMFPGGARGEAGTEQQARANALKALKANPSWAQVLDPTFSKDWRESKVTGQLANLGIDLWLGAPKLTGEKIFAGDSAAFEASPYVAKKTVFAFNALKQGKLGESVASMEGGRGAENLAVALEPGIKSGDISYGEFKQHVSDLFNHGHTTVGDTQITDGAGLFESLRTKDLVTPGKTRMAVQDLKAKVKAVNDQFEETLRARSQSGITQNALDYVRTLRQATERANPAGQTRAIFDARVPEDTYNYARVNLDASPTEAAALRDELIRLRAANDVQGVTAFGDKLRTLYEAKHPNVEIAPNPVDSSGPLLESESRHTLYFPKGVENRAQAINDKLNTVGRLHRQTIVSGSPVFGVPIPGGGEVLAWKHAVADTVRRMVGGGGPLFGMTADTRSGKALVDDFMHDEPAAIREVGTAKSSSVMGENRYITGRKPTDPLSFNTGDAKIAVKGKEVTRASALKSAGGYLRNNLTSNGLKAFQASTKDDLQPLVELVMKDKFYRSQLDKMVAREQEQNPLGSLTADMGLADKAQVYAEALFNRYSEIENAGKAAGVADPLNEALDTLVGNVGPHADTALGKWIDTNKISLPVREGLVEKKSWDDATQWWIGKLMTANKWNRGKLFDHVFYGTVKDLTDVGWKIDEAVPVAASLAKTQTVAHMLDFSNMMQAEQNLRWLSYFATKHRLYWTWILNQAIHRPGLAFAVNDVSKKLDANGNLDFSLFGHQLKVPVARLFWLNSTDLPQTSPLVQFLAEAVKAAPQGPVGAFNTAYGSLTSTSGNLFTRDDQAEMYAIKTALVATGHLAANSDVITTGMTADQKRLFQEQVNEYSQFYRAAHGVYPSEPDAVKHVLLVQTAEGFWASNLPLPVQPATGRSTRLTKLMDQYGQIINPVEKRAFLEAHPAVGLQFGVSQDPTVYLHNNQLWDKFNAAYAQVKQQRTAIYQEILKGQAFTPAIQRQMKALSAKWTATIDQLKAEDSATWQGTTEFPKKNKDGSPAPGPWTIQLSGDPFAARAFVHQSFPGIKPPELDAHTVGERIVSLQARVAQLRSAKTDAQAASFGVKTLQGAHDEITAINTQLAPFFAYPTSASAQLQSEYYNKFVGPYQKERDKLTALTVNASSDNLDQVKSQLRAWKDDHDHPVYIMSGGVRIKFPSVVQIGWATLPAATRHLALQQAASGDWAHIASYEKTMLGVKTPPDVGKGWSAYYEAVTAYNKVPSNSSLVAAQKVGLAKQIDKAYPGFFKDYLFSRQPKIDRFKYTDLYKQMPDKSLFDQYIVGPAEQTAKAIKTNGSRNYYEKAWRNYVETQVVPWLNSQPQLKAEVAGYGPNFLNTLPSVSAG